MGRVCSANGEKTTTYRNLMRKPRGTIPLRPRYRWVDNIKIDLGETGLGSIYITYITNCNWAYAR
jgi:hypothetical protein